MKPIHPDERGLLDDLEALCRLERDFGTDLGLAPASKRDHPILCSARAALGSPADGPRGEFLFEVDSIRSQNAIPWDRLEESSLVNKDADRLVRYVITELVRNVDEHSEAPSGGFLRVAHTEKGTRIAVGIADRGIGLKKALSRFHPVSDDSSAVQAALTPGVSGATSKIGGNQVNAGAGLYFMRGIAALSGASFLLVSGRAAWHFAGPAVDALSLHDGHLILLDGVGWEGTAAAVEIPTNPPHSRDWYFDVLNKAYRHFVRDAKHDLHRRRSLMGDEFFSRS